MMTEWKLSPCKLYVYKKNTRCPDINDGRCHGSCDVGHRGEDCLYETSDDYAFVIKTMINLGNSNDDIREYVMKLRRKSYLRGVNKRKAIKAIKK